jgi:hypothetical protein
MTILTTAHIAAMNWIVSLDKNLIIDQGMKKEISYRRELAEQIIVLAKTYIRHLNEAERHEQLTGGMHVDAGQNHRVDAVHTARTLRLLAKDL